MSTALERIEVLKSLNTKNPEYINPDLYRILYKPDIFVLAYEKIKSKEGNMTRGVNRETLDGISENWIENIIIELRSFKFKFSPGRIVEIAKKDGKIRKICIAPPREKVIQEAMRLILESIYDAPNGTIFKDCSHGFRTKRSCHTALKDIKHTWSGTKWFIEGDISNCFDEIDHHILIGLLREKIRDEKFIDLMWKYLRAGYNEKNSVNKVANLSGTPQGGILSPLLSNIYLNELDTYILGLKEPFYQGTKRKINPEYSKISKKISKTSNPQEIKEFIKERRKIQSTLANDPDYIKINYVRYADDWIIGVIGSKKLTEEIKIKVEQFLKIDLKLRLNLDKTFIRHAKTEVANFLGIEINTNMNKANHSIIKKGKKVKAPSDMIQLNVNMNGIIQRLKDAGLCDGNGFPICRKAYINFEDWEIIQTHNSILNGISNYYSFVNNRSKLQRIEYIILYSAAKTLAGKHKTSIGKIFKSYGKYLTVKYGTNKNKSTSIRNDIDWKKNSTNFMVSMWERSAVLEGLLNKRKLTKSRLGKVCVICGKNDGNQMHHVRHIRKSGVKYGGFDKYLGAINRKQVPLCKHHHLEVHKGKYDGKSLAQIFDEVKSHQQIS